MSKIEWTDKTWNVITGCTQVSPACQNCYAKAMTKRLQGMGKKGIKGAEKYEKEFNKSITRLDSSKEIEKWAFEKEITRGQHKGLLRGIPKTIGKEYCLNWIYIQ